MFQIKSVFGRLPTLAMGSTVAVFALAILASVLAQSLKPTQHVERQGVKVAAMLPPTVKEWREVKSNLVQMSLTPNGEDRSTAVAASYDDTAMTSYVDAEGHAVMVALAYGSSQRQEGKIHRPELCYSAQGFKVSTNVPAQLQLADGSNVRIQRLETSYRNRREIVSYWIRIGDLFSNSAFQTRTHIMKVGLQGQVPDGILFRVSQIVPADMPAAELAQAYVRQEAFMTALAASLSGGARQMLVGDHLAHQPRSANETT